jgi:uracil-DNA glycosylase
VWTGLFAAAAFFTTVAIGFGWLILIIFPLGTGGRVNPEYAGNVILWTIACGICWAIYKALDKEGQRREQQATDAEVAAEEAEVGRSQLPKNWRIALEDRGMDPAQVGDLIDAAYDAHELVFPPRDDVMRAFSSTRRKDVRVVILGQDPYYTVGDADGLAFSVPKGRSIPTSLQKIFAGIANDVELQLTPRRSGNLKRWADQGVLLLNSALTVEEGLPGSHQDHWRDFTRAVLNVLADSSKPTFFIVLGSPAHKLIDTVTLPSRHHVIKLAHPASREDTKWPKVEKSDVFSRANEFLGRHGRGRIDWS